MGTPSRHRPRTRAAGPIAGLAALSLLFTLTVADTYAAARSPLASESAGRLAVAELQGNHTVLWAVDAADPRRRTVLGDMGHANGWGVKAQTAPDGRYLAYVTFPPSGIDPTADGELWVVDTDTTARRRLGTGLDALAAPRWSPDGSQVVVRRVDADAATMDLLAYAADLTDGPAVQLASQKGVDWVGAIGWRDGRFTYATIDSSGTWLRTAGTTDRVQLSPGIARDFALSPDGTRLVFAEAPGPNAAGLNLATVDLDSHAITRLPVTPGAFSPTWAPDGSLTVAGGTSSLTLQGAAVTLDPATGAIAGQALRPAPGRAVAPVDWNPAGSQLAARLLPANPQSAAEDQLALVDSATGLPRPLAFSGYAGFAGWLR